MSNTIGYFGPPSLNPNFAPNPYASLVPQKITLQLGEVQQALSDLNLPPWQNLSPSQRKMVAAYILENRETPQDNAQANKVLSGNPAFQTFEIIVGIAGL